MGAPTRQHMMMVPTTLLLTIITIGFLTPEVLGEVPVLDASCEHGNCVDGTGEKIVPNEGTYVGQFKKSTFEGHGVFTFKSGPVYDGQWVNGEAHGHAVYNWPNGDKYDGEYRHDQKSGEGTITWPSGRHYTGGWLTRGRATASSSASMSLDTTAHGKMTDLMAMGTTYPPTTPCTKASG